MESKTTDVDRVAVAYRTPGELDVVLRGDQVVRAAALREVVPASDVVVMDVGLGDERNREATARDYLLDALEVPLGIDDDRELAVMRDVTPVPEVRGLKHFDFHDDLAFRQRPATVSGLPITSTNQELALVRSARHRTRRPVTFTQSIEDVVSTLRGTVRSGATGTFEWRRHQLRELRRLVTEEETALEDALRADLGKPRVESWLTDLALVTSEIDYALRHLRSWMRPERAFVPLTQMPAKARIVRQPLGVIAVISPWNYPVNLTLAPTVGALAAGNTVVVKPSELAPASSRALSELVARHLDPAAVTVVEGGPNVADGILDAGVDHVVFTGGRSAAREVFAAAAKHLTPVTLELGGKNPAIVLSDADLGVAARRIAWGRFLNAGQTCVAPDYVLVETSVEERFVEYLRSAIEELFGSDPRMSDAYARIIDERHLERLAMLLDGHGGELLAGGSVDRATRYFAPTVVRAPNPESALMREEVFGPILVVQPVANLKAALARVSEHPDPLALYLFTSSRERADDIIHRTRSGGVGVNTTVLQVAIPGLPFGGVGASGTGAYHGRAGYERLSHARAVFEKSTRLDLRVLYPPYRSWKDALMRKAQRWGSPPRQSTD